MKTAAYKLLVVFGLLASIGCSRKSAPTIIYQDKIVTKTDTLRLISKETDTIPCDDFEYIFLTDTEHDTVFVEVEKQVLKVRTVVKRDTVVRNTIIVQPAARKMINRIDNSVRTVAKKGSAIGDGNTITNKSKNWWWIFIAGMLTWALIQNVIFRLLKTYIPVLKFLP